MHEISKLEEKKSKAAWRIFIKNELYISLFNKITTIMKSSIIRCTFTLF